MQVTDAHGQALSFEQTIILEQLRLSRLKKYQMLFGIVSIMVLFLVIVSIKMYLPYEPAAAVASCCIGTFVVFAMKVKDAQG